jgi:hypothetical protein
MGTLFRSGSDGDWESSSGRGKHKVTRGSKGGWDYSSQRNFGTGPGSGCAVAIVAGAASLLAAGAAVGQVLA